MDELAAPIRRRMLLELAGCLVYLRSDVHDPDGPDTYGHAFQVVLDAAFDALVDQDHELAIRLVGSIFLEIDAARARIRNDLRLNTVEDLFFYSTEPLLAAMELAGCALLLQELHGAGSWNEVRGLWDATFDARPAGELEKELLEIITLIDQPFVITQGRLARTGRMQRMTQVLRDNNVEADEDDGYILPRPKGPQNLSPIVRAMAPHDLGGLYDLVDLFAAAYLGPRTSQTPLPRSASLLASDIARKESEQTEQRKKDGRGERGRPGTDSKKAGET